MKRLNENSLKRFHMRAAYLQKEKTSPKANSKFSKDRFPITTKPPQATPHHQPKTLIKAKELVSTSKAGIVPAPETEATPPLKALSRLFGQAAQVSSRTKANSHLLPALLNSRFPIFVNLGKLKFFFSLLASRVSRRRRHALLC